MSWTNKNLYIFNFKLTIAVFVVMFSVLFLANTAKAADTLVSAVDGALYAKDALAGPYWIDTNTAAVIFINGSQDMYYASTTDAGATWNSSSVMTGTVKHAASWFDQETPGDNGTLVHMAWVNRITDGIYYNTLDVSNGTLGIQRTVDSSVTVDDVSTHRVAITKTVSGNLMLCFSTLVEVACYRSTDSGVNWTAIADAYETATENDWLMLYPANTSDDDDAVGIFWDRSASELSVKMYDNSANSWTETSIATSMANSGVYMNMDAAVRHSDKHILLAAWNAVDTPTADLMTWDLTVDSIASPTVTAKTDILTDQIDAAQAGMVINQQNDDIYLAYLKGTAFGATVDVVYKKSSDGMDTWGVETAYSEAASDDFRTVEGGHTIGNSGGYVQFAFFEDDLNNLFVNLTNDVAISAVVNTTPNTPTLVSPANTSYTADNTPTLSANYSDSDSADVGTTNYRISSSSLLDCTNNTNIVASGTSSETASNNEDTTYTPASSIGSDGTYYWCAQNNDGVATSSWTQMGSFTLDTTAPTNIGINSVTADSSSQITVVADTAVDSGAGLNSTPYWFDETSGESGATDSSSYQLSTTYVDSGLSPNTQYSYRVKAKDAVENESSYSSASSIYTLANVPSSLSLSGGSEQITAGWSANSNPSSTEYYIENTTAGTNSGWITSTNWVSSGLGCGTVYSFRIKARNGDNVETSYASTVSASTNNCPGGGVPAGFYAPISIPDSGWQVTVSNPSSSSGQSSDSTIQISDRYVSLSFNANSDITGVSISRYADFNDGAIQAYSPNIDWDICSSFGGLVKDDICLAGNYTLYIKFYNTYGRTSDTIEQKIYFDPKNIETSYRLIKYQNDPKVYKLENNIKQWIKDAETFNSLGYKWTDIEIISDDKIYPSGQDIVYNLVVKQTQDIFVSYLSHGSIGPEVRELQTLLKKLGYFNYPSITGYYGSITTQAVKDFQRAYGIDVLGIVGPKTREKLNSF